MRLSLATRPLAIITKLGKMKREYIFLVGCLTITALNTKASNQQLHVPQTNPQAQYDDSRASVTGIINRIPRSFDTQTLINSGPGLLQESFFLLKKLSNKNPQQIQNQELPTVKEPQTPTLPSTEEVIFKENQTHVYSSKQQTNSDSNKNTIFTNNSNQTSQLDPIKPISKEPPSIEKDPIATIQMVPAPRPGFVIRYNDQLKVYEELREIKIQEIQPIKAE